MSSPANKSKSSLDSSGVAAQTHTHDLFFVLEAGDLEEAPQTQRKELRSGDICPLCGEYALDYDGLLNLACPKCGPLAGGCFT